MYYYATVAQLVKFSICNCEVLTVLSLSTRHLEKEIHAFFGTYLNTETIKRKKTNL